MDHYLQVFVTVAEKKNFSRAAEELHMTQPAVSQYIRTFEDNFGVRLLERTNKYVRLNKAGEIVYHHAKQIVGLYTKMHHLVDDLANKASGTLSIGASYTFGEYIIPHIIAKMQSLYPSIQPTVTIGNTSDIAQLTLNHQLDVGIVEGHIKTEKDLCIEEFTDDYMSVVASPQHPLAIKHEVTIKDLEEQRWILREFGSGTREAAETVLKRFEISPTQIMSLGSTQPIKEAVEAGLGISLLSQWTIQKELRHGDLKILKLKGLPYVRKFSIVTTSSPFQTKALQVFLDLLKHDKSLTTLNDTEKE
ncbi:LysR family transcriptional regulator [Pullulanibacillus camelliae]|uniref:LysR family transcriptional regulator n=1 Tax=Pullulanibacillus camelliae TaxID=1707096 RepID=A0A8J2VIQ1_9BACL|nr:LysR family transcriptional regulator [Pullulanibacillus camelliae]GGE27460.1 LysR family transcriptional regulator [Pullulanibacillus camelliae]